MKTSSKKQTAKKGALASYCYKLFSSPVGDLTLIASERGLVAVLWENDDPKRVRLGAVTRDPKNRYLAETEKQLKEYFSGKRKTFDLKLDFVGTDFQRTVWSALQNIPYGKTRSYGEIAKEIKRPKAYRAVGIANGKNPISIIVACHRVIGASGALVGFAGGLETKSFLLELERAHS